MNENMMVKQGQTYINEKTRYTENDESIIQNKIKLNVKTLHGRFISNERLQVNKLG